MNVANSEWAIIDNARDHCRMMARLMQHNHPPHATAPEFLLRHGQLMQRRSSLERGPAPPRQCYQNAYSLARCAPKTFRYVEGYATSVIPVEHAWCIDRDGAVVDPTWDDKYKPDYFGMVIDVKLVARVRKITRAWPVLWSWWKWHEIWEILEAEYADGNRPGAEGQRIEAAHGGGARKAGPPARHGVGGASA